MQKISFLLLKKLKNTGKCPALLFLAARGQRDTRRLKNKRPQGSPPAVSKIGAQEHTRVHFYCPDPVLHPIAPTPPPPPTRVG